MARILITRRLPGDPHDRLTAEGHDVDVWEGDLPPSDEELRDRAQGAEGLITLLTERVDGDLLDALPGLKVVSNYAVGSDNIDLDAAEARGVAVGVTPDVLTEATADLAWALMLTAARGIVPAAADVHAGRWRTWEPQGWIGRDVHGASLLVVGAGRIGQAVAKRGDGLRHGRRRRRHRRRPDGDAAEGGLRVAARPADASRPRGSSAPSSSRR